MIKFTTRRPLYEVKAKAAAEGWEVDTRLYEKGGQWLWLRDTQNRMIQVMLNTLNYRFYLFKPVKDTPSFYNVQPAATEMSVEFEGEAWYDEILDLLYSA